MIAAATLLSSIPSPSRGVWYLGPIPLRAYAFCILIGMATAIWLTTKRYSRRGGDPDLVIDVALVSIPLGIVGARVYHVLSSWEPFFGPNGDPWEAFKIWHGGIGVWGGVLTAVVVAAIFLKIRGVETAPFADAAAPGILIAQGIGRLGNWFNQEVFGAPTTLPWGLEIDADRLAPFGIAPGTLVHPTFLYEMIWNFAFAALLIWLDHRYKTYGWQIFWGYAAAYCLGRILMEGIRVDTTDYVNGFRVNLWASVVTLIVALILIVVFARLRWPTVVTVKAQTYPAELQDQPTSSTVADSKASSKHDGDNPKTSIAHSE